MLRVLAALKQAQDTVAELSVNEDSEVAQQIADIAALLHASEEDFDEERG